jgi:nucleoside-diphosphate-sugar epimerase
LENEEQISKARESGLEAVALRFFNVYGVGQRSDSAYAAVIPKFVDVMVQGKAPRVHGDGLQTRDFVHVNDVCNAILKFLSTAWYGEKHHVFNIDHSHVAINPIFDSDRIGDIRHSMADITRLKDATDWAPTVNFSDGIRELVVEAYKQNLQK